MKFSDICGAFAARDMFYCGVPVEEIARQANKSVATVKKMIKMACGVVSWESAKWLRYRHLAEILEEARLQPALDFGGDWA